MESSWKTKRKMASTGILGTPGLVLKGKWTLTSFIAAGACAEVWAVASDEKTAAFEKRDRETGWVVKVCREPAFRSAAEKKKKRKATPEELVASTVSWEHQLYQSMLRGHSAVPAVPVRDGYGESGGLRFLVMERLGETLSGRWAASGFAFSPQQVAGYGGQMLEALRQVHGRRLLYIDVKPENFMFRRTTASGEVSCERAAMGQGSLSLPLREPLLSWSSPFVALVPRYAERSSW